MDTPALFNLQTVCSLLLFGLIAKWYLWPWLKQMDKGNALAILLLFSGFRYLGTSFLVPELTKDLPSWWATTTGYGDLISGAVAVIAAVLARTGSGIGAAAAWLYFLVGTVDFIYAGSRSGDAQVPLHIGANWPIMTVGGPAWMMTLVMIVVVLLKHPGGKGAR